MSGLGIEGVLAGHVALGEDDDGITQCSCGAIAVWRRDSADDEDSVRYLVTHAEGPDLRWHIAHVAAVLREEALVEVWDEGYEACTSDIEARSTPPSPSGPVDPTHNPYRAAQVAPSRVPGEET